MSVSEWGESAPGRKYLKQRRGATWYVFKSAGDKWSLKTTDYDEACRLYDSANLNEERPANGLITVEQAWSTYILEHPLSDSTRALYGSCWKQWIQPRIGRKRVADVTVADITGVYKAAVAAGRTHDNIHRCLSSFFRACTEGDTNYRTDNPVARVGKRWRPVVSTGLVDEDVVVIPLEKIEEMAGLAEVANPNRRDEYVGAIQLGAIVRLQSRIGCRINELLGLALPDFKLDSKRPDRRFKEVHIERQIAFGFKAKDATTWFSNLKGRKGSIGSAARRITLTAEADKIVGEYIDRGIAEGWLKPGGLLFPNLYQRPRSSGHVISKVTELHKLVGNEATGTHCFRHTAASIWLSNGMPIERVAALLGHSIEVCRTRYALMIDSDQENAQNERWMAV